MRHETTGVTRARPTAGLALAVALLAPMVLGSPAWPQGADSGAAAAAAELVKMAKPEDRFVIAEFYDKSAESARLQKEILADPAVQAALQGKSLHVRYGSSPATKAFFDKFGVKTLPTVLLISKKGEIVSRLEGALTKEQLLSEFGKIEGGAAVPAEPAKPDLSGVPGTGAPALPKSEETVPVKEEDAASKSSAAPGGGDEVPPAKGEESKQPLAAAPAKAEGPAKAAAPADPKAGQEEKAPENPAAKGAPAGAASPQALKVVGSMASPAQRVVVAEFSGTNPESARLKTEVFETPEVLATVVTRGVHVRYLSTPEVAQFFAEVGVRNLPTILLVDANGQLLGRLEGPITKEALLSKFAEAEAKAGAAPVAAPAAKAVATPAKETAQPTVSGTNAEEQQGKGQGSAGGYQQGQGQGGAGGYQQGQGGAGGTQQGQGGYQQGGAQPVPQQPGVVVQPAAPKGGAPDAVAEALNHAGRFGKLALVIFTTRSPEFLKMESETFGDYEVRRILNDKYTRVVIYRSPATEYLFVRHGVNPLPKFDPTIIVFHPSGGEVRRFEGYARVDLMKRILMTAWEANPRRREPSGPTGPTGPAGGPGGTPR